MPALRHRCLDPQHLLLADREGGVDRIELHDGGELGRPGDADQTAHRYEMRGDHAVERRGDLRVAEVDRGDRHPGLIVLYLGLVGIALGAGLVDLRLRGEVALAQRGLPGELGLGLNQVGLGGRQRGLRLLQLRLIRRRLDHEQRVGLLGRRAILVVDLLQVALHPRLEIDLIVGDRVAGDFQVRQSRPAARASRRRPAAAAAGRRRSLSYTPRLPPASGSAPRGTAGRGRNSCPHPIPPAWPGAVHPILRRGGSARTTSRRSPRRRPASGTSRRSGSRHRPRRARPSTPFRRGSARTR